MQVLKIKIYQPQAHYRIPYTYQRRHTYPLPPYSTVIGLLCNLLEIQNISGKGEPDDEKYKKLKGTGIAICGRFDSKTTEYVWFRNISKASHEGRFSHYKNRYVGGHIEHFGGQQPVTIDILNEVFLWIYLIHEDRGFLKSIKDSLEKPDHRLYPLHLGRAEDWIVIKEIKEDVNIELNRVFGHGDKFFWLPLTSIKDRSKITGLFYRVPTFYRLIDQKRNFEFVETYLYSEGFTGNVETYVDRDENELPLFFFNYKREVS